MFDWDTRTKLRQKKIGVLPCARWVRVVKYTYRQGEQPLRIGTEPADDNRS